MSGTVPIRAALVAAALAAAGPSRAASVAAVLSSDSLPYRQALEGFVEAWGSSVPVFAAGANLPEETLAVAAFGSKAALRRWPPNTIVVACLAPSAQALKGGAVTSISLLPEPETLVASLRALFPRMKTLRIFWSSEAARGDAEALAKAGAGRGLVVLSEKVDPPSRLPQHIRGLGGRADALLVMPDPALVTAVNLAMLREYAESHRLPFLGTTEGMTSLGLTATIEVSFREMGRGAARTLRSRLAGGDVPWVVYAGSVTVKVGAGLRP